MFGTAWYDTLRIQDRQSRTASQYSDPIKDANSPLSTGSWSGIVTVQ